MRDVTVTKATGPFAHQTLTHAPLQTRVGRAHRTPDTLPAALNPTTRACTKPVLTQVWITRHSLALKPHVSWKQYERWWSFAGSNYWSLLSRDRQPETNKQTNKKQTNTQPETNQPTNSRIKEAAQAARRRCAEAAGVSNDRLTCGWTISALRLWAPDQLSDKWTNSSANTELCSSKAEQRLERCR